MTHKVDFEIDLPGGGCAEVWNEYGRLMISLGPRIQTELQPHPEYDPFEYLQDQGVPAADLAAIARGLGKAWLDYADKLDGG